MTNFKKLRGKRILLSKPNTEKSSIELTTTQQAEIDAYLMKKWTTLEVFAIGDAVKDIAVGDKVYISPSTIMHAELIDVEGGQKFLIREMDVVLTW